MAGQESIADADVALVLLSEVVAAQAGYDPTSQEGVLCRMAFIKDAVLGGLDVGTSLDERGGVF